METLRIASVAFRRLYFHKVVLYDSAKGRRMNPLVCSVSQMDLFLFGRKHQQPVYVSSRTGLNFAYTYDASRCVRVATLCHGPFDATVDIDEQLR